MSVHVVVLALVVALAFGASAVAGSASPAVLQTTALRALAALSPMTGYDRDQFGSG